jgi:hypothetical protein
MATRLVVLLVHTFVANLSPMLTQADLVCIVPTPEVTIANLSLL